MAVNTGLCNCAACDQASLALGYIPQISINCRVSFIQKPGRLDYTAAKAIGQLVSQPFYLNDWGNWIDFFKMGCYRLYHYFVVVLVVAFAV